MKTKFVLSVEEVADILNISKDLAYTVFRRQDFPSMRIGKKLIVRADKFFAWTECKEEISKINKEDIMQNFKKSKNIFDELPLVLTVEDVMGIIGIGATKTKYLFHSEGFPRLDILKRSLVLKDSFIQWYENNKEAANNGKKTASKK